jgi:MoaA/NifB/PqqE/SkfB family radical SAM enzyme/peroxiredoxin
MRRRADLKTGTTCNSNCVFCVIGDQLFTGDRTTEACIAELRESRKTCIDVVFTGAEVSIRPDFFRLLRAARSLGYERIQIQTNGRIFVYREFCERAIAAGANEFAPAIHGHIAKLHDGLTRAPGSFAQIVTAIEHMVALGVPVISNTVVTKQNAKHMPALARLVVDLGVSQFQLAFPHPTGHAATHFRGVVPRMSEVAAYVHEALDIGRRAGVLAMAEAMPYCMMAGHEDQVGELHIPPTEIVYDGYVVPDYATDRMDRGKVRFSQCATCRFEPICEGPWKEYPAGMGDAEFVPVVGARVVDPRVILEGRLAMIGAAAPSVIGDAGWRAVCFVPEAGSPACTSELCAIDAAHDVLVGKGIAVHVVAPNDEGAVRAWAQQHGSRATMIADPDRTLADAWRVRGRTSFLVDPQGNVAHVLVDVDTNAHGLQLARAFDRLHAPPRPLGQAHDLVTLRRGNAPAATASGPA